MYTALNSRQTVCRGGLNTTGGAEPGSVRFAEKLESGRCLRGCTLVLKNGLKDYSEICGGRVTEAGRLDILEGASLVTSLIDAGMARQEAATAAATFQLKSESISNFATMFDKGCQTPKAYEELKRDFQQTSRGADARANQLLRPQQTMFDVFGTDVCRV